MKFYGAGHGAGIKPIVGADFNVQCDLLGDELTHLTVLAANNTGYQNLTLLISKAYQRGMCRWLIIDRDWLIELNEGLILLSGGRMGDIAGRSLLRGNSALVDECVAFYEEHFPDRYFLELIRTGRPDEEAICTRRWNWRKRAVCPSWRPTTCALSTAATLTHTKSASRSTTALPSTILNARVTIRRSNICVAKRRCASCLPTSPKLLPTPLRSPNVVT
ncbi:PHP domain-containing protein [Escherichia coli]